jgi:TonB family protein
VQSAGLPQVQKSAIAQPTGPVEPNSTSVELTFKPAPEYTAEAKQMKIQGDVVLRVTFSASGHVQVLNVVRGLGHGLDEQAQRTVQMYKFKPATQNGKPIDKTVNITITFQLA